MVLLKQEIDTNLAAILDLSKWKLAVLSVLTAAGLGVLKDVIFFSYGYLLLFLAPYVCIYIDLLIYEREARIHQIAKYIRHYSGENTEYRDLQVYEIYINDRRAEAKGNWLPHEHIAQICSSLAAGIAIPLLACLVDPYWNALQGKRWLFIIPTVGVFVMIVLYLKAKHQIRKLSKLDTASAIAAASTSAARIQQTAVPPTRQEPNAR